MDTSVRTARVNCLLADGRLLARLTAAAPATPVPSCPGWSAADVLGHTGGGFRWASLVVGDRVQVHERELPDPPGDPDALLSWYDDALQEVSALLAETDPALPCWIPVGRMETVSWWQRKVAVEAALHRHDVDAATAPGRGCESAAIESSVAGDGIDEFVADFLPGMLAFTEGAKPTGTVRLEPVDDRRSWSLDLDAGMDEVLRRSAEPAATVLSATASDLLLWIWNRLPDLGRINVVGNAGVLTEWSALTI